LGHGKDDVKVKQVWGEGMRDVMEDLKVEVRWKVYDELAHWWCEEEMTDIAAFLERVCGTNDRGTEAGGKSSKQ
jgi:predicted esterase